MYMWEKLIKSLKYGTWAFRQRISPVSFAVYFCLVFGIAMIVETFSNGDGDWFWYAKLARSGFKLYSDLRLPFQPYFTMETIANQSIFGESWIASKIPALIHLIAYITGIFLLLRHTALSSRQKAVAVLFSFFFGIRFEWYRFDDFHVVCDIIYLYIALLIRVLPHHHRAWETRGIAILLGILTAVSCTNRPNDGAGLLGYVVVALSILFRGNLWAILSIFIASFLLTATAILALMRDSMQSWLANSILKTAAVKGGTALFVLDPVLVLTNATGFLVNVAWRALLPLSLLAISCLCFKSVYQEENTVTNQKHTIRVIFGLAILLFGSFVAQSSTTGNLELAFLSLGIMAIYGTFLAAAVTLIIPAQTQKLYFEQRKWLCLIIFPAFICAGWSISTAGSFIQLFFPVALFSLLIVQNSRILSLRPIADIYFTIISIVAVATIGYKLWNPATWQNYVVPPLFAPRQLAYHPTYGPIVIDPELKHFSDQICAFINDGSSNPELLSLPWTYGNFYCAIPPWHNFVQTWFDTTPATVIDDLIDDLAAKPPTWIFYQRQPEILAANENVYNHEHPLAQRTLDELIMSRIATGEWTVVLTTPGALNGQWLLIKTRQPSLFGPNLILNPNGTDGLAHWQVMNNFSDPVWSVNNSDDSSVTVEKNGTSDSEAVLSHPMKFMKSGPVTFTAQIKTDGFTFQGVGGYGMSIYDSTKNLTVASTGMAIADTGLIPVLMHAKVNTSDAYVFRLHYVGATGRVAFSRIRLGYGYTSNPSPEFTALNVLLRPTESNNLSKWEANKFTPVWSPLPRQGFILRQSGSSNAESLLRQQLSFSRSGLITLQVHIDAKITPPLLSYGYVVDLFDDSTHTIAGSLSVPAKPLISRTYLFSANVNKSRRYFLRLRVSAAHSSVTFSQLNLSYANPLTTQTSTYPP